MRNNFLAFAVAVITTSGFSQNASLSPYSYFGFGQSVSNRTAENNAMGGMSVYADSTQFSLENPATLGKLNFVQYNFGAAYKAATLMSDQSTDDNKNASLRYLSLSVPTKYLAFGFGLKPKTGIGYRLRTVEEINAAENIILHQGSGGLNSTFLSLAANPIKGLSLGASMYYNFGYNEKTFTRTVSGVELNTQVFTRAELSGIQYTLGAHYIETILSDYQIQLSATITPNASLESINSRQIATVSSNGTIATSEDIDLGNLAQSSNSLPAETRLGVGFGKKQNWFVGATYTSANQGITNPLEVNPDVVYTAASRWSFGGFYVPQYNSFSSYLKRVVYRGGIRFEDTGINLKNQNIKDFGITFGLGLPIGNFSKANIGVELGKLGTKNAGLIEEKYTAITIGFSLSDIWFIKRKYD